MISEVVMPQMGADMTEGTVLRWLKHEGEAVTRGEIIAEIETDKANVEIEAFEGGVFRKAIASEGDVVPVGQIIAIVAAPEDDISRYANGAAAAPATDAKRAPATGAPAQTTPYDERPPTPPAPTARRAEPVPPAPPAAEPQTAPPRLRASPVARRIADERGIDLRLLRGTGPDGRIIKRDVESAPAPVTSAPPPQRAAPPAPLPAPTVASGRLVPSKMRQAIARRMAQSKREAPHYYLLLDVDMTDAMAFRKQANAALAEDARITVNDLVVKACAIALQRHPMFNVTIDGEQLIAHDAQNVCIAIALDGGLIAPALLDTGRKPLAQIAREASDLAARARGGALRQPELTEGTFSITNLGAYGVEALIGIIQPPQTAILGVGTVMPRPAVRDGGVVARDVMKVALSADHRVTDGALGAQFLGEIKRLLEQPLALVL